ncbi:hypothetical protein BCR43DRAFT_527888 [Syncephalastrum racemosum]|uniref:BZIP domain-containing protein n=1 Tax=Syncephalastrum racemosum TaxID=13706 RepID=A0A1X2H2N9_SYNRA|nr:hypothetical protein BCR43DRAFT_527888 [Syncephalastrum racemosum]
MTITRDTIHRQAAIANHGALSLKQPSFIDSLNMEMDPVSILTDAELQRELDFFANAQFTFDVEPGTAAASKTSCAKSLHHHQPEEVCHSPMALEKPDGKAFDMEALLLDQSPHGLSVNNHRVHPQVLSAPGTPRTTVPPSSALPYATETWHHPAQAQQAAAWPTQPQGVAHDLGQFTNPHYASSPTDSSSHGWSTPMPSPSVSADGHAAGFFAEKSVEPAVSASVPSWTPNRRRSRRATTQADGRQRRPRAAKQQVILIEHSAEEEDDGNDSENYSEEEDDNNEQDKGKARRTSNKQHHHQQEGEETEDGHPTRLSKDDKRKRNTAASARFRIKKKMREQALQRTAYEMTEKSKRLELHIKDLEREIGWLKALVVEKNQARIDRLVRERPLPRAHTHTVTLDYPSGDDNYF